MCGRERPAFARARLRAARGRRGSACSRRRRALPEDRGGRSAKNGKAPRLRTAISEAVERYNPEREAVVMIESEKGFEVSIVTTSGSKSVGGLFYEPDES